MKRQKKSISKIIIGIVILLGLIIIPLVTHISISNMSILVSILLYMYWASAWNIMGGYAGLFSLGNGIYIGIGAYVTACLYTYCGITPWIGIILSGVLTGLFSIALSYPTFRLQSIYYSFATFALLNVMLTIFKNFSSIAGVDLGGAEGFRISASGNDPANMVFSSKLPYYYIILALLVIVLIVSYLISHSKRGFYFRALSANAGAASSLGVSVMRMKIEAQFISAFFCAVGGGFYCMFIRLIDPAKMFGSELSINVMIMAVVGGANTLFGPILGGGLMYAINRLITVYCSNIAGLANMIFGAILMLVIFFLPGGLLPFFKNLREKRSGTKKHAEARKKEGGGKK